MLIVEGADEVGKTTMCDTMVKILQERTGEEITSGHMGRRPRNFNYYWGYRRLFRRWHIQDRFHLGEWAYEKAQERTPRYTRTSLLILHSWLLSQGALVVHVTTKTEEMLRDRLLKNPDDKFTIPVVLAARSNFIQLTDWCYCVNVITTPEEPFPSEIQISGICTAYIERQREVIRLAESRHLEDPVL